MANLMAVGWLPPCPRHAALLGRLKRQFRGEIPSVVRVEDDLDHLVWWGIAARGIQDQALLAEVVLKVQSFDKQVKAFANPNLLGHACRLLGSSDSRGGDHLGR